MIRAVVLVFVGLLAGCGGTRIEEFAGEQTRMRPEHFFVGRLQGSGVFVDLFGNVRDQFVMDMTGHRQGEDVILDEMFTFKDGRKERRVWTIRKTGEEHYEGRAADIVGVATGRTAGNVLNWRFVLPVDIGIGRVDAQFDQWMFLQDSGVLINRAEVSARGLPIGQVIVAFHRLDGPLASLP